jgi:hypothetical protein
MIPIINPLAWAKVTMWHEGNTRASMSLCAKTAVQRGIEECVIRIAQSCALGRKAQQDYKTVRGDEKCKACQSRCVAMHKHMRNGWVQDCILKPLSAECVVNAVFAHDSSSALVHIMKTRFVDFDFEG